MNLTAAEMQRDYALWALNVGHEGYWQKRRDMGLGAVDLMTEFAKRNGVTLADLRSSKRKRPLVLHRQDCMLMLRDTTKLSLPQIGRLLNRDHTTVKFGIERAKKRRRAVT